MNFQDADKITLSMVEDLFCEKCRHEDICKGECDFMSDLEGFLQCYQEIE